MEIWSQNLYNYSKKDKRSKEAHFVPHLLQLETLDKLKKTSNKLLISYVTKCDNFKLVTTYDNLRLLLKTCYDLENLVTNDIRL